MAIVAIGAIGAAPYTEVKYKFGATNTEASSKYPIDALIKSQTQVSFDKTLILLTEGAKKKHWGTEAGININLAAIKEKAGQICPVDIPDGKNEMEFWEIFDKIVENVNEGDELYIDITQGLRHLPVLMLIACAYLRTARNVTIKSISYGAFELRRKNEPPILDECDIFELLPFVSLFDWGSAVKAFQRNGDTGVLAELLMTSAKNTGLDKEAKKELEGVANRLETVSLALQLARPDEALEEIENLNKELHSGQKNFKQYAKPFDLVWNLLTTSFSNLNVPKVQPATSTIEERLERQRKLIEWYQDKKNLALSILLAREWLVSKHMVKNGKAAQIDQYTSRNGVAGELGDANNIKTSLHQAFVDIREARNDIAHMGQANTRLTAQQLRDKIKEKLKELDNIK